ncbi:hypothetical protein QFC19_008443 [Naganishia cerealis]|uniref:Uncharacterized protein n=1 Tax=Naganishia cerealis TaxID=610337 RepID=A0ACC2V2K5_9TREE|nr:hypothetical protein QFC19_008443 [Naganishia cerealis]
MAGFGFIEFEEARDAEDAVAKYDGAKLLGEPIMVEFAKERRPREFDPRGGPGGYGGGGPPGGAPYGAPPRRSGPGVKVLLKGVGSDVSWQDLKDFGREAGRPLRSDVDRSTGDGPHLGSLATAVVEVAVATVAATAVAAATVVATVVTAVTEEATEAMAATEVVTEAMAATEVATEATAATEAVIADTAATEAVIADTPLHDGTTSLGTAAHPDVVELAPPL